VCWGGGRGFRVSLSSCGEGFSRSKYKLRVWNETTGGLWDKPESAMCIA